MPATIHFISKTTDATYGPYGQYGLNVLDDMIAKHIGFPVNPDKWCNAWDSMIAACFAFNDSVEQIREDFAKQEERFPGWTETYKVPATLDYLIENFYIRNDWGKDSTIKELDKPTKPRAKVK